MMDLKNSNNYKLSPGEIVGKISKKPRNWFRFFLNSVGALFLLLVLFFGIYRMWVYYSIFNMTPKTDMELYLILDDQSLEQSQHWNAILNSYLENNTNLSPILWDSLLRNNKYYLSIYQETSEDPVKFLFYLPKLDNSSQELLKKLAIPFIYNGKFLLLNDTAYFKEEASVDLFDFNILNRVAVGSYEGNYFILHEDKGQILIDLPDIIGDSNTYLSYIDYKGRQNELYFASNDLKWAELSQYLNFLSVLPADDEDSVELALLNQENTIFGRDFLVIFKQAKNVDLFLENLEYLFAYNNRKVVEKNLADASVLEEEVLDFGKFAWQEENFYKKILISENENLYLYSTLQDGNLILSSQLSELENLQNMNLLNLTHYYFMKSDFFADLDSWSELTNYCNNWTLKYGSFLQVQACE